MARKTGELKKRCWLAKQRLKMGYFDSIRARQESDSESSGAIAVEYSQRISRGHGIQASAIDDKMYRKVCDILDGNEVTLNPIGQLIDREVYDGLDSTGKQRYVLELSEKFRQLQERYYRERTGS